MVELRSYQNKKGVSYALVLFKVSALQLSLMEYKGNTISITLTILKAGISLSFEMNEGWLP